MLLQRQQGATSQQSLDKFGFPETGLPAGTLIYTLDGALPVEFLNPGDRLVTRAGTRVLVDIDACLDGGFALSFSAPEVIYADGEEIATA